ncbi:MAG TPA: DUF3857 domain-containing protein [Bryobacteraceae bacterium]|jgi:hypothetical protein|nr:DUF3857 domain-containing protein [Bryobacteraceae bacterium]
MFAALFRVVLYAILLFPTACYAVEWKPVSPEELALKESRVEKNADAEVLEWDVRVADTLFNAEYEHHAMVHYLRIKIFTDKGKDERGTVKIEYQNKETVGDVSGRTIRPDGSIVEMSHDAVFDKVVAKAGGLKVRERSFALPGIVPGAIIEYRWSVTRDESFARYLPLPLQLDIPVEQVTYHVKPLVTPYFPYLMRSIPFNCKTDGFKAESNGYYSMTVRNVPSFQREPQMPPEDFLKQWILIYYEENKNLSGDKYWNFMGKQLYQEYKVKMKVNGDVKQIAEAAMEGAKTDDEKLEKLLLYCRKNLKDVNGDEITTQERNKLKANVTTADTLRAGRGTYYEIELAFAALATAAGFDARLAYLPNRGDFFFSKSILSTYFLNTYDIAVQVNGKWKFYDVANRNLPAGVLRWQEQGVAALVTDPKEPRFELTPLTSATDSRSVHIAEMTLSSDGTLEGDVRVILSGHPEFGWRERLGTATDAEREEDLKAGLKRRFADFELSAVKFHAGDNVSDPIGYTYHIKVNNYAQRTGKRLFVAPAYFEAGMGARFPESKRQYPICFEYPWSEADTVNIKLPTGYELDHADAPGQAKFAPAGSYSVKMAISKSDNMLHYKRDFVFGEDGTIMVDAQNYGILKRIFDAVHEGDGHMLTLRASAPAAVGTN